MTLVISPYFLKGSTAKLKLGYGFGLSTLLGYAPFTTWWNLLNSSRRQVSVLCAPSLRRLAEWSLQQKLTDVSQADVDIVYRHLEGQVARRKCERKHRYLLSLGKFA
jgi:hypothetical protein